MTTKWVRQGKAALLRNLQMEIAKWGKHNKEEIAKAPVEEQRVVQEILNLLEASIQVETKSYRLKFYIGERDKPCLFSFSKNVERVCREYGFPTEQGIAYIERRCLKHFGVEHPYRVYKDKNQLFVQEKHDSAPREIPWDVNLYETTR